MEKNLDNLNFEAEIKNSAVPVIVDFFASWCGPCRMMAPVLESLKNKFEGSILVLKVDIDSYSDLAQKYNIMSVPTLMFFSNGELVRRETGFIPAEKLEEIIKSDFCITSNKA